MDAKVSQGLQVQTWINPQKITMKHGSCSQLFQKSWEQRWRKTPISCNLPNNKGGNNQPVLRKACSSEILQVAPLEELNILKNKGQEVEPQLRGRCIYLVGMMGSGKTTIGEVLAEAVGYGFCDCDKLIEQEVDKDIVKDVEKDVDGTTVAQIFKIYGEPFFRDNETMKLKELSFEHRLVVSTGGGAVIRPINWRHMQKGISVWLDVPLDALARRITAFGTHSRPLLNGGSGGPSYKKTMSHLEKLYKGRGKAYANADARVSLENIAAKLGIKDVCDISREAIAIEALVQIENNMDKINERHY